MLTPNQITTIRTLMTKDKTAVLFGREIDYHCLDGLQFDGDIYLNNKQYHCIVNQIKQGEVRITLTRYETHFSSNSISRTVFLQKNGGVGIF